MTIRLTCNTDDTAVLLGNILIEVEKGNRVMFLCEPGCGQRRIQAARVMLTRVRNAQRNARKKRKHFTLRHTIHPWTESGKRYDCVVVWQVKTTRHKMIETLDDMIGSGDTL